MPKQLVIKVQSDGSVRVETVGLSGDACLEYAQVAQDMCGAALTDQTLTPDYYAVVEEGPARAETDDLT